MSNRHDDHHAELEAARERIRELEDALAQSYAEPAKEAQRYSNLFEHTPLGYQSLDEDGNFIEVNQTWLDTLGYERSEVIGKNFSDFLDRKWRDHFKESFPRFKTTGEVLGVEFEMVRKDGSRILTAFNGCIGKTDDGKFRQTHCVFQDITRQRQVEKNLETTREHYKTIIQTAIDGFVRCDSRGRIMEVNDSYCAMSGYSRDELLTMAVSDLKSREAPDEVEAHMQTIRTTGRDRFDSIHQHKSGTQYDVEVNVQYHPEEGGSFVSFVKDISERKRTERTMQSRLRLMEYATSHTIEELLQKTIDEAEWTTGSKAGFYTFIDEQRQEVTLSTWSERTIREMCNTDPDFTHYPISQAGLWVDCVKERRTIIYNDYLSLPHRKGLPEGHAPLIRLLLIPIFRRHHIVAVLGLANKPTDYTDVDASQSSLLADMVWDIVEQKKAAQEIREREERYRRLFESSNDALFIYPFRNNQFGSFIEVNDTACHMLGYTAEELKQKRPEDIVWRLDEQGGWIRDLMTTKGSGVFERLYAHKNGKIFPVEESNRIFTSKGETFVLSIVRDNTIRKRDEQLLRRQSAINAASADIARVLTQPDSKLEDIAFKVHEHALHITESRHGYVSSIDPSTGENIGLTLSAMMHTDACAVADHQIAFSKTPDGYPGLYGHSLNTLESFFTNIPRNHPSSKGLPEGHVPIKNFLSVPAVYQGVLYGQIALANAKRLYTEEDVEAVEPLAHLFAMAMHRKRHEQDMAVARKAAEAANQTKSQFLANMSHEIRTPLNGIMGMLQLTQTTELDEQQQEYNDLALQSCRRLTTLLGDVLDLSKIEADKVSLENNQFSLRDVIESINDLFQFQVQQSGITVDFTIDDRIPDTLIGDESRLRQILFNLIGNALKFTEQGSVMIEVTQLGGQGRFLFTIRDTGIGIPDDKLDSIFEPFTQSEGSFTREYQGAGLGLTIVKRLVDLKKGTLCIASTVGEGTEVHLSLPYPVARDDEPKVTDQKEHDPVQMDNTITILVVEDDYVNRLSLTLTLEKKGITVLAAEDGHEALDVLQDNDPDLILMDIQLPNLDGVEATRRIRSDPAFEGKAHIPIIALTAYAMRGDKEKFIKAGMNDYLSKPLKFEDLEVILEKHLGSATGK